MKPTRNDAGVQFHEGILKTNHEKWWFPKGGLLVLDDLMADGGEDKDKLLNLFTKHSHHQNITVLYLCHQGNTLRVFSGTPTT